MSEVKYFRWRRVRNRTLPSSFAHRIEELSAEEMAAKKKRQSAALRLVDQLYNAETNRISSHGKDV